VNDSSIQDEQLVLVANVDIDLQGAANRLVQSSRQVSQKDLLFDRLDDFYLLR
jgi:hypothetical protein